MDMKPSNDMVVIHDLAQAAFLMARHHPLRRLEGNGRKAFIFDASARQDAEQFYANAPIGALEYAAAMKHAKAVLYGDR